MTAISAVIITFNEERNIARCIKSLQGVVDEIIVWDSFSTDATPQICKSFDVHFFQDTWKGYAESKNAAVLKSTHDWILSIDADEALSVELAESIKQWKQHAPINATIKRKIIYCGKAIAYGDWNPDIKHRIYNKRHTKWHGTIHEVLVSDLNTEFKTQLLKGNCLHYTYYTLEEHKTQALRFTNLMIDAKIKQKQRTYWISRFLSSSLKWLKGYILKAGFIDGRSGFHIACISAWAAYQKHKIWYKLQNQTLDKTL